MEKKKDVIEVLHEKDLKNFLMELNKYNEFENKKIFCRFCREPITYENIYGIFLINGETEFICDKESCYAKFLIYNEDNNV